jgi:hypothetical protein
MPEINNSPSFRQFQFFDHTGSTIEAMRKPSVKLRPWRQAPQSDLKPSNCVSGDSTQNGKSPRQCGLLGDRFNVSVGDRTGWLMSQSHSNPSPMKFPANREKNREFCQFQSESAIWAPSQPANSIAYSQIPCKTEQGIIPAEQGINFKEQGILAAKIEIIAG